MTDGVCFFSLSQGVDKTGTFLGTMTYSSPSGGRQTQTSLGIELLRHGLATLHGSYDPNRHANGPELVTAQDAAKHKRLGVWVDWSPEKEAAEKAAAEAAASSAAAGGNGHETAAGTQTVAELCSLGVTEVVDASRFFCQRAGGDRAAWVHSQLQALAPNSSRVGFEPRKGAMVAGRFTGDDEWYRAIVVSVAKERGIDDSVRVHYCDFGNGKRLLLSLFVPELFTRTFEY
jgi:staphylococcal nuclease domain-containing protein 1